MKKFIYLFVAVLMFTGLNVQAQSDIKHTTKFSSVSSSDKERGSWSRWETSNATARIMTMQGKYDGQYGLAFDNANGSTALWCTLQYRETKNGKYIYDILLLNNNKYRFSTVESTAKLSDASTAKVDNVTIQMNLLEPEVDNVYSKFKLSGASLVE